MIVVSAKKWPLRCPDCRELVLLELPPEAEPGHTGTLRCMRGHAFLYQYDGHVVDVVGAAHVRGRQKPRS